MSLSRSRSRKVWLHTGGKIWHLEEPVFEKIILKNQCHKRNLETDMAIEKPCVSKVFKVSDLTIFF